MAELDKIVDQLSKLTVMEAADLAKMLEEAWGVSASAPVMAAVAAQGESAPKAAEEKSEYDIILESAGDKKINVIKEVKAITGLGLKEAKEFVESAPKPIKLAVPKSEAEELKGKLEAAGAKISLK
ncbi:50S ribosomal protein L7/L12 [Candidatus Bandiella numerosa]|uniref:50S ribosomal protein L7/L12 n=1 Tax=Candidatus Bandiella numerosa TaxID=2570586 RepID=UPI00249DF384|nr:50S ribosomal protein L7/L12 [Candidatus Bandiella numerosa]WHA04961.1 50S ribosomal protein L7/L12 [Candidatus Bandiella numerosa]